MNPKKYRKASNKEGSLKVPSDHDSSNLEKRKVPKKGGSAKVPCADNSTNLDKDKKPNEEDKICLPIALGCTGLDMIQKDNTHLIWMETSYRPNMFSGPLDNKEIKINDYLSVFLDIGQFNWWTMYDPTVTCTYNVHLRERKHNVWRTIQGTYTIEPSNFSIMGVNCIYLNIAISNEDDTNEPAKYKIEYRIIIKEPLDANFKSSFFIAS